MEMEMGLHADLAKVPTQSLPFFCVCVCLSLSLASICLCLCFCPCPSICPAPYHCPGLFPCPCSLSPFLLLAFSLHFPSARLRCTHTSGNDRGAADTQRGDGAAARAHSGSASQSGREGGAGASSVLHAASLPLPRTLPLLPTRPLPPTLLCFALLERCLLLPAYVPQIICAASLHIIYMCVLSMYAYDVYVYTHCKAYVLDTGILCVQHAVYTRATKDVQTRQGDAPRRTHPHAFLWHTHAASTNTLDAWQHDACTNTAALSLFLSLSLSVCVCVCVCVRARACACV